MAKLTDIQIITILNQNFPNREEFRTAKIKKRIHENKLYDQCLIKFHKQYLIQNIENNNIFQTDDEICNNIHMVTNVNIIFNNKQLLKEDFIIKYDEHIIYENGQWNKIFIDIVNEYSTIGKAFNNFGINGINWSSCYRHFSILVKKNNIFVPICIPFILKLTVYDILIVDKYDVVFKYIK